MTNLNELSKQIYEANKLKGFDAKNENIGQTLMLIVSELSEALEALRKNRRANLELYDHNTTNNGLEFELAFQVEIKDTFEDEIADSIIRLFDLCGALEIDIERHIELKRAYNSLRPYKHGKEF